MRISYNWLQSYFAEPLPSPAEVSEALTFHAWEIEEMEENESDTVLDVKVLPDKSAWALSHRGVAKDLSVILSKRLVKDPLATEPLLSPTTDRITLTVTSEKVKRYTAALIEGVTVAESPEWLKARLTAIGQKPINNIVDATNYVMFGIGQPLHAFDAGKLDPSLAITVRSAKDGEAIETLMKETRTLTKDDLLIVDSATDAPIGIAGVKGGSRAAIDAHTTSILIESANFDPVSVRKTAQRHKLRTDASMRFENGILPSMTPFAIAEVVELILEIAGGTVVRYQDAYPHPIPVQSVAVSIAKINSMLSLALAKEDVQKIFDLFGYPYTVQNGIIEVTPPVERPDLAIAEDLIEEIGRIYGYDHVSSIPPEPAVVPEVNARFFNAESVRDTLAARGFSEVFTSSFRSNDTVKLVNALASDKGFLRSSLTPNIDEVLAKNAPLADLLGMRQVKVFEIGTVFDANGEHVSLAVGVRSPGGYKAKADAPVLAEALKAVSDAIGGTLSGGAEKGIFEIDFDAVIASLTSPASYQPFLKREDPVYKPFSLYPSATRDIALWVPEGTNASDVEDLIRAHAGSLLVRLSLFDEFTKDGKISYAFRLVLQSPETTLTDSDITQAMERVGVALTAKGYALR